MAGSPDIEDLLVSSRDLIDWVLSVAEMYACFKSVQLSSYAPRLFR